MNAIVRLGRAVSALLLIVAIVGGVPALLLAIGADPLPELFTSWTRLRDALTSPDDGTLLLALLVVTAWASWAVLTVALLIEAAGRARGIPVPRRPSLSVPQGLARGLVGAVAAAFVTVQPATAMTLAAPVVATSVAAPGLFTTDVGTLPQSESVGRATPTTAAHQTSSSAPAPADLTHTVQRGETLWSLAERYLSDGSRYAEIVQLNYGRVQRDGSALTDSHWIMPGWQLRVPDERTSEPRAAQGGATSVSEESVASAEDVAAPVRVVQPGESLWDIAESELGDGNRWPQIYSASRHLDQPGRARLGNPDHLRPGWQVALPTPDDVTQDDVTQVDATATPPTSVPPPLSTTPAPTSRATATPLSSTPAPTTPAPTTAGHVPGHPASADVLDDLDEGSRWTTRTTGGVGALLAAGILGTLGTRRRVQNLRRRPGQPAPRVAAALADAERRLRAAADPLGVTTIDLVLRSLARHCAQIGAALPALRAARLTSARFEIYLERPVELPRPWFCPEGTPAGLVWAVYPDDAPILSEEELADIPAPYPALVTLGHDHEDAHFLIDLERLGVLDLAGPHDLARAALGAIALELATSTWADDVQVTVVGEFAGLEDTMKTGRLRYLPVLGDALDDLAARAAQDEALLAGAGGVDLQQARALGIEPDTWAPQILLIATPMTAEQQDRLVELVGRRPRTAWAGVTLDSGRGRWTLRLTTRDGDAELDPIGLRLRPQLLDDDTRSQVQHLVALADPDAITADAITADVTAPAEEDPRGTGPTHPRLEAVRDERDPMSVSVPALEPEQAPVVRVLGSVLIEGARGQVEPTKRARLAELVAYLALNPGVGHVLIDEAIWPGRRHEDNLNTRNTATSKARAWLGRDDSGHEFLPRHAAATGYTLSTRVRTDWSMWRALVGDASLTADTQDLEAALALVRGRPFDGVHPRRYAWADTLRQHMCTQIVDVAYELARRRVLAGRWQAAEAATAVGLMVEPAWEPLWRLRIMAAHEARNQPGVDEAIARMLVITDAVTGDLEPATSELLAALQSSSGDALAALRTEISS